MSGQIDTERILDAFLAAEADRLADRVIDAALADVARTRQRRAMRTPWRFLLMPVLTRGSGIAAIALVAVVGAGTLFYVNSNPPGGVGAGPTPVPTVAPTVAPTLSPSPSSTEVAPGITGWTPYTSAVYGFTMGYPVDWADRAPASRAWQPGDSPLDDAWPFADGFASPELDQVGLWVWQMPAGEGADVESVQGLKAWADGFCTDVGEVSCGEFTQGAEPMCLDRGGQTCRAALLVPRPGEGQYAFFVDWDSAAPTAQPDLVNVVYVGREDTHPSAARYGGSVALLESILTTMGVTTPAPGEVPG